MNTTPGSCKQGLIFQFTQSRPSHFSFGLWYEFKSSFLSFLIFRSLYRLKAVIVHIGEVWSGHFVTFRRAINTEDAWVYVSDEYTKLASKQTVLANTAYLLFYERIEDI